MHSEGTDSIYAGSTYLLNHHCLKRQGLTYVFADPKVKTNMV